MNLYSKTIKVIDSCETIEQLKVAGKFMDLSFKKLQLPLNNTWTVWRNMAHNIDLYKKFVKVISDKEDELLRQD